MFTHWKELRACWRLGDVSPNLLFSASKCVIFQMKITKGCHWRPGPANQTVNNIHHPGPGIQTSSVHISNPDMMFHPHQPLDRLKWHNYQGVIDVSKYNIRALSGSTSCCRCTFEFADSHWRQWSFKMMQKEKNAKRRAVAVCQRNTAVFTNCF